MATNLNALKLYEGWVQHTRLEPEKHQFRYQYFQTWLDVEKPELIDEISQYWSSKKINFVRFQQKKYQPSNQSIHTTVSNIIKEKTDNEFKGKIYLLASLTHWGYCYNPVSFYFCYDHHQKLQYILSEIHNTPWGERFTYLHSVPANDTEISSHLKNHNSGILKFNFDKRFHVSPFMPMGLDYEWSFNITDSKIVISMNLQQNSKTIFNATMNLVEQTLTKKKANQIALRYPFICLKVITAIYWQAFRLWVKRTPFYSHPDKTI